MKDIEVGGMGAVDRPSDGIGGASEVVVRGPGQVPPEGNANEDSGSEKATDVGCTRVEGECSRGECCCGWGYWGKGACWGARGARA